MTLIVQHYGFHMISQCIIVILGRLLENKITRHIVNL